MSAPATQQAPRHAPDASPRPQLTGHLSYLRADSPLRPLDWRYRLAMTHLDAGRALNSQDAVLLGLYRLLGHLRRHGDAQPVPTLLAPYDAALRLRREPDETRRAILEAGLLARRSPALAGRAAGLPADVAAAYAAACYDVRDRLHCAGFIAGAVLRVTQPPQPTLGYWLRAYALAGGPLVLDDLLHRFALGQHALTPPQPSPDPVLDDLCIRAAIATQLLPPKPATSRYLCEIAIRYLRLDQLKRDPERHRAAHVRLLTAQLNGAKRLLGVAVRDNPFLVALLNPRNPVAGGPADAAKCARS